MFALRHYRGGLREMFAGGEITSDWTQFSNSKLKDALPHDHNGGPNGAPVMQIPPDARFGRTTSKRDGAGGTCLPGPEQLT